MAVKTERERHSDKATHAQPASVAYWLLCSTCMSMQLPEQGWVGPLG